MAKTVLTMLLIEDSPEYAELVKRWLAARSDIEFVLDWKDSLKAGLNRVAKGGVDAVLLDLGLQDSRPEVTLEPDSLGGGSMKTIAETLAAARAEVPLRELTGQRMRR